MMLLADQVTTQGEIIAGNDILIAKDQLKTASTRVQLNGGTIVSRQGNIGDSEW
ncbi:hypothetical protein P4S72_28640 [Vibrio sp. PP-XX7]